MPTLNEAALNSEFNLSRDHMHRISIAIADARKRNDAQAVAALLPLYQTWLARHKEAGRQLGALDFTAFDRFVLTTGTYVEQAAAAIPDAVAALPSAVGKGLLKGALPFAAIALLYLFIRGKL